MKQLHIYSVIVFWLIAIDSITTQQLIKHDTKEHNKKWLSEHNGESLMGFM